MSRIKSKDTKPEVTLRSAIFSLGFRYKLHVSDLPGKPDMVFSKKKIAVFIHGCFWHLHKECRDGRFPKSKLEYWKPKLQKNVERDKKNRESLQKSGWKVVTVWECEINRNLDKAANHVVKALLKNRVHLDVGSRNSNNQMGN